MREQLPKTPPQGNLRLALHNVKYASQLSPKDYIFAPKHPFPFDWSSLVAMHPDDENVCFLVALDRMQIDVILSYLSMAGYYRLWGLPNRKQWGATETQQWDDIQSFIAGLEYCLMSGCNVELLIKSNLLIAAAISGDSVDLDDDISDLITGVKDYASIGLSPQLIANSGNNLADVTENLSDQQSLELAAIKTAIDNLETALQDIKATIEAGEDLEDDLANVWNAVSAVATILGGTVGVPPIPL